MRSPRCFPSVCLLNLVWAPGHTGPAWLLRATPSPSPGRKAVECAPQSRYKMGGSDSPVLTWARRSLVETRSGAQECLSAKSVPVRTSLPPLLHTQPGGGGGTVVWYGEGGSRHPRTRRGKSGPGRWARTEVRSTGPESGEQEVWSPLSRIYRTSRQSAECEMHREQEWRWSSRRWPSTSAWLLLIRFLS